jgi:hypothetical protein
MFTSWSWLFLVSRQQPTRISQQEEMNKQEEDRPCMAWRGGKHQQEEAVAGWWCVVLAGCVLVLKQVTHYAISY